MCCSSDFTLVLVGIWNVLETSLKTNVDCFYERNNELERVFNYLFCLLIVKLNCGAYFHISASFVAITHFECSLGL